MADMGLAKILGHIEGRLWLVLGVLFLVSTTAYSVIRSAITIPMGIGDLLYLSIDWLAACIIYFFLGAMGGHILDWLTALFRRKRIGHPLWFWLTLLLWIVCSSVMALSKTSESAALILVFPLAYGMFFAGMAFTMLLPKAIVQSHYGKLLFDILFFSLFAAWLCLYLNRPKAMALLRILILLIFAVFFLGFYGCAKALG